MAWFASWLWEGVVIVLLVSAMLRGLRRVDAATRYAIWWGTLLAIICWPAVTLARAVGAGLAKELIFTGRLVDADEALRIGLVQGVHDPVLEHALATARLVAAKSPGQEGP